MQTLTIPSTHNGPMSSGNGGWTAGRLAAALDPTRPVTVSLRQPPPLDTELQVTAQGDTATLLGADGSTIATAKQALGAEAPLLQPVSVEAAAETSGRYRGLDNHPFPTCYSCGTDRDDAEALRLLPGTLPGRSDATACVWNVRGHVDTAVLWAALDCPGGWSVDLAGRPMVLGTMTAHALTLPTTDDVCVVVGECTATVGKKAYTSTNVWRGNELLGWATAVWIAVDPAVFNALRA